MHAHLIPEAPDIVHLFIKLKANATHHIHSNSTQAEDKQWVNTKALKELIPVVCYFLGSNLALGIRLFLVTLRQTDIQDPSQDSEQRTCQAAGYEDIASRPHALVDRIRIIEQETKKHHHRSRKKKASDFAPIIFDIHDKMSHPCANQHMRYARDGREYTLWIKADALACSIGHMVDMVVAEQLEVHNRLHVGSVEFETIGYALHDAIDDHQHSSHPRAVFRLSSEHKQAAKDTHKTQTWEHAQDTDMLDRIGPNGLQEGCSFFGDLSKKHSKPAQCPTYENNEQTTGDNLLSHRPSESVASLLVRDIHGYTHAEDEEWEDEVGRCATIPCRMAKRRIDM